jgi:hypothetical protein
MSELLFNVRGIFDASTRRGCLTQYGCRAYRIPPYQRGYKWGSEDNQPVERLLSDLTQAWKGHAKEYLLQAITVKKVSDGGHSGALEVIDGQQRLTTLFILLRTLNTRLSNSEDPNIAEGKLRYAIRHEALSLDDLVSSVIDSVGDSTASFATLKDEQGVAQERHQDGYYLKCAVLRCLHALRSDPSSSDFPSEQELAKFRSFVLEDVKLMVNAVEPHVSGEVIFGNLNTNRVDLTETELIKGLLLTRVAREPVAERTRRYRETLELRLQLGRKWDELHRWANQPEHRSLYFPGSRDGITGLLELVAMQMAEPHKVTTDAPTVKNPLFEYFLRQTHIEPVFRLLSNTQARLQDWYTDEKTYHLLGFCLMNRKLSERPGFLVDCLNCKTNSGFHAGLLQQRSNLLRGRKFPFGKGSGNGEVDVSQLRYGEDNDQISRILLALSFFQGVRGGRFNFHAFQEEKWSLEHIFPQSPFGRSAQLSITQKRATLEVLTRNEGEILAKETVEEIARNGIPTDDDEMKEIDRLLKSEPLLHQLGNLCLLSSGDNAAMGCGMFDEKREVVRRRIARGSFVPRHTYEVFSRMIVGETGSLNVWSKSDIQTHEAEIQKRLHRLLKEEEDA